MYVECGNDSSVPDKRQIDVSELNGGVGDENIADKLAAKA